jgi:hypothetical protein
MAFGIVTRPCPSATGVRFAATSQTAEWAQQLLSRKARPMIPFGDLFVLVIILMPFIATIVMFRSEPLRLDGLAGPAVR